LYTPQHISKIINANLVGESNQTVKHLLIDSRQLTEPSHSVFVALKSERNDGHQYISGLIHKGVKIFIVHHIPENCIGLQDDICFLMVADTLKALQQLATDHREQFNLPVIGVTGSNGKTIVKEWLYQLLKTDYNIARSPKTVIVEDCNLSLYSCNSPGVGGTSTSCPLIISIRGFGL
jgi:alanine racemase